MDISNFAHVSGLAALAVVALQQILKLNFVPGAFANRYPVPTNILLSIGAAMIAVWQTNAINPVTWTGWLQLVATIAVVAAIVYNQLIGRWAQLKAAEGEGK